VDPRKFHDFDEERYVPEERHSPEMEAKFRVTAERAIEEFKILNDYAPDDPWVHVQLAYSYHDLQMPQEEIREYEIVLALRPNDKETLFKLGMLYFQQGMNAKGLRIYEALKETHYKKAESLIKFYGSYEEQIL
jgi:tetratricopeptide (TPR) repeat protein